MIRNFTIKGRRTFDVELNLSEAFHHERGLLLCAAAGKMYEADTVNVMLRAIEPGDLVVDVGAHCGFFAVLCANLAGPDGHVLCFEPEPSNASRLRANVALNYLGNVTLLEQAAAEFSGTARLCRHPTNDGGHWLWDISVNAQDAPPETAVEVATSSLDDALSAFGGRIPKLVKIDAEGAEHHVLKGARQLLRRGGPPFVIAELHDAALETMGTTQAALRGFMRDFGYETFALFEHGGLPKFVPEGVRILSKRVLNLLFSSVDRVAKLWPIDIFDPA